MNKIKVFDNPRIIRIKDSCNPICSPNNILITGIDEAGRGPVIGPMIIALTSFTTDKLDRLKSFGVKDSKKLTPTARMALLPTILNYASKVYVAVIPPNVIDSWVLNKGLNRLEAYVIALMILKAKPHGKIYIDSPSSTMTFESYLRQYLPNQLMERIITENKADIKYVAVSAASIVAKVIRDMNIKQLKKKLNINFGSGYPSDPLTRKHLKIILKIAPNIVRKSWKTMKKETNRKLTEFLN